MAELEIHHEHEDEKDPVGKKVGILAAVLAVFLAIVTISSHRAHTAAILSKTNANDQWNLYQANRLKAHNLEVGSDVIAVITKGEGPGEKKIEEYKKGIEKYEDKAKETMEAAKKYEEETEHVEKRALYFDMGEGLLEIALVLSSLYFIARKMLFPVVGVIAGLCGLGVAAVGFLS
jgi:ribosome-binding ATPase YchF (GTP1/OBG family)